MRTSSKLSIGAALIGSVILSFSGAAQAYDHWDRDHDRDRDYYRQVEHDRGNHYGHDRVIERRVVEERPVYVHEHRPIIVERPVMMAPPVYQQPVYQQPGPSGLNLNFNIPLN